MNTNDTRHTAATLTTAGVVAAALTIMSGIAPTAASAHQADPSGPATHWIVSDGSAGTIDVPLQIAHLKSQLAQYYIDHALELYQQRDVH